ncbi:pyridoxal phosphate-dependent decarboxylase family protein [Gryllotalpicola protaetiae]|uniref:Aspartate aminotransferase family protein n=1 Tax=Gryllotalpicola protaetiae TaxID=2419771 RepID=A0A387BPV2_9MICO|nr:aminotransferase class V-fold PLP-dependent enzyme [Gryllotalpicola protaetiae]AYG04522.1 aspartate aminotransferase family protein [Gryllotalpicola protaetiae]
MSELEEFAEALEVAHRNASRWLASLPERPIAPHADIDQIKDALGRELPSHGTPAPEVVEHLATAGEPGLVGMPSSRFFGFVIGGTLPAALGADWLVSAWDQNTGMRLTPTTTGAEELAAGWVLELLGLPAVSGVGFVTGATTANFTCLTAARDRVLERAGWRSGRDGLAGGPKVRFLAGAERHESVESAGRMAGLGLPRLIPADDEGRIDVAALEAALAEGEGPAIVALQAGNVHSGAFDDFAAAVDVIHAADAWAHIDGAFGLWAAASPRFRHLTAGFAAADSWATDAHKTLNTPYDCGVAVVADRSALTEAMGFTAAYLPEDGTMSEPHDLVPELSRRARGVPVWAALRELGRDGVVALVDRLAGAAAGLAAGLGGIPGLCVVNDVVFTQVCVAATGDEATVALGDALLADGVAYASPSRWHGQAVLRFSVSNAHTDAEAVARTIDAVTRAAAKAGLAQESVGLA